MQKQSIKSIKLNHKKKVKIRRADGVVQYYYVSENWIAENEAGEQVTIKSLLKAGIKKLRIQR